MKKFLISLGALGLLAAPAAAGRLDVEPQIVTPSAQTTAAAVDYSGTRAIQATGDFGSAGADRSDSQRGAQSTVFGANSR